MPVRSSAPPPAAPARGELVDGTAAGGRWRASRPGISFVSESARSVPAIVSPIVPPICWKNVRLAVALPTWRGSTVFWTSAANRAKDGPTPSPATTIQTHSIGSSVLARRFVMQEQAHREE